MNYFRSFGKANDISTIMQVQFLKTESKLMSQDYIISYAFIFNVDWLGRIHYGVTSLFNLIASIMEIIFNRELIRLIG